MGIGVLGCNRALDQRLRDGRRNLRSDERAVGYLYIGEPPGMSSQPLGGDSRATCVVGYGGWVTVTVGGYGDGGLR